MKDQQLLRSLAAKSFKQVLEKLANRQNAYLVYHPRQHVREWYQPEEILERFVFLKHTNPSRIKSMLEGLHPNLNLESVELSYPAPETILLQGPNQDLELIERN